jgi:hypothetical protein
LNSSKSPIPLPTQPSPKLQIWKSSTPWTKRGKRKMEKPEKGTGRIPYPPAHAPRVRGGPWNRRLPSFAVPSAGLRGGGGRSCARSRQESAPCLGLVLVEGQPGIVHRSRMQSPFSDFRKGSGPTISQPPQTRARASPIPPLLPSVLQPADAARAVKALARFVAGSA